METILQMFFIHNDETMSQAQWLYVWKTEYGIIVYFS